MLEDECHFWRINRKVNYGGPNIVKVLSLFNILLIITGSCANVEMNAETTHGIVYVIE